MTNASTDLAAGIAKVDAVLEQLAPRRAEFFADAERSDRSGELGPETLDAIRLAGGCRVAMGGLIGAGALARLGIGLAELHPSAAWNCIVSNTNRLLAQSFAERSGMDFQAHVDAATAGGPDDAQWCGVFASQEATATRHCSDRDRHVVTGVWRYASNSDHAEWAMLNVAHEDLGPAFVVVPRAALEVRANWSAIGLRGTGSHTLAVRDLEVDGAQLLPVGPLYRDDPAGPIGLRLPSRLRTAFGLAAVAVGSAVALHAALVDAVAATSGPPAGVGMPGRRIDGPGIAIGLGEISSKVRSARLTLIATADELDAAAAAGGVVDAAQLHGARLLLSRVTRDIADAAHEASLLAGTRACLEGDAVGRLWRDTHIAARHAALSPRIGFDLGGRALVHPDTDPAAAVGPLAPGTPAQGTLAGGGAAR